MKRKEEREQFANEQIKGAEKLYGYKYSIKDVECACLSGAEWADETMKNKLIAELTKLRDNAIEEMKKDKTTSTPEYYSACGQAHAYVQVMNMIYENF